MPATFVFSNQQILLATQHRDNLELGTLGVFLILAQVGSNPPTHGLTTDGVNIPTVL